MEFELHGETLKQELIQKCKESLARGDHIREAARKYIEDKEKELKLKHLQ